MKNLSYFLNFNVLNKNYSLLLDSTILLAQFLEHVNSYLVLEKENLISILMVENQLVSFFQHSDACMPSSVKYSRLFNLRVSVLAYIIA